MKQQLMWIGFLMLIPVLAWSQRVDQGRPGTQGPWPVLVSGGSSTTVSFDGGFIGTVVTAPCAHYRETNTSVGAAAAIVPATPLANRVWVRICNSVLNTSSAICVCSATSTPTFAASSLGDALAVSDCSMYPIGTKDAGVPQCICNGAGVQLPAAECAVQ